MKKIKSRHEHVGLSSANILLLVLGLLAPQAYADVRVSSIFGNHMVLQSGQKNRVWGWATDGEDVTVSINDQKHVTVAGNDEKWSVMLDVIPVGGPYHLTVKGNNELVFNDVLVGEVWICSGQSNMAWPVSRANDAVLEIKTAKYSNIRLISVPQVGTQNPQESFEGQWKVCSPETVAGFSAVGYFFGRQLHQMLGVPIGLVNNAWGGSACEAWIQREVLEADELYKPLLDWWVEKEQSYNHKQAMVVYKQQLKRWQERAAKAKPLGQRVAERPRAPSNLFESNHRPANIYNGVLKPIIGYGIRGVIWYQGETNAPVAYQYRHLFPLMIQHWRNEWDQGEFPFYWVQLADFNDEPVEPQGSDWAELREAQTMTLSKLPKTGQAVIIDLGEARDIHPRNKQDVAKRLARWALARDYEVNIAYRSPEYKSMKSEGNSFVLKFDHVGSGLYTFDVKEPVGFAIAGADKQFVWAAAEIITKNSVRVWSDQVAEPVAVRYAWADNPVCNLQSREGLLVTPFRTDDWPGVTMGVHVRQR